MVIGGVETVFITTMNELLKEPDLEIVVITHDKVQEPLYADWFATHPELKVYIYRPLGNWFQGLMKYCTKFPLKPLRKIAFSLYKKYRRVFMWATRRLSDVDVFIDYKNLEFARELSYFNKPKIAWLHSSLAYFQQNGSFTKLPQYNKIVGLTDDFVNEFKEKYPQYSDRIYRIYNPIDVKAIKRQAKQAKVPSCKYFSHVSRLVAGKDIKTLLNAFDIFYVHHPDIKLYIVGDGCMADTFKAYANTLKCHNNVVFVGAMSNPYGIMRGAIANLLSSEYEGFGMVVLESIALDVLAVSSNCKNGPREILENGMSGLLFEVGDVETLVAHMETALTDVRIQKIEHATNGLARFSPTVIARQIKELVS